MLWRCRTSAAIASILILGVACHRTRPEPVNPQGNLRLTIRSHHQSDLVISVIHDQVTVRVGTVAPGTIQVFMIPLRRLGPSRMFHLGAFHLGAAQGYVTESLYVTEGQEILWNLEKYLVQSVAYIR